jgi:acetyltransferase
MEKYCKMNSSDIEVFIKPKSVAIVGASCDIQKVGGAITRNVLEGDYKGKIYLVNPNSKRIFGKKVYPSLDAIQDEVDLVEIVVPALLVPKIMEQAVEKGVKGAIIVSSGFAEIGRKDLQDQVLRIAKRGAIRIIGPNCFGLINTEIGLDLSFTFSKPLKGSIAFISQSGAMCCGTLDWASKEEVGFSKFINLGNKCDIDEADALVYLREDLQTKVIAIYIEGIQDGGKLFKAVKLVSKKKPVVILKAGITIPGARAALSHTGSIAGQAEIVQAILKQAGAILVDDAEELFDTIRVFTQPKSKGKNIAIISNAGGLAVMTSDWCYKLGLAVPKIPKKTVQKLKSFLPSIASALNPIDLTGDADYERYKKVLQVISEIDTIDIIISIFVSQGLITSDKPAIAVVESQKYIDKPILAYWMGGNSILNGVRILKSGGVPVYSSPERVARAATKLVISRSYSQKRAKNDIICNYHKVKARDEASDVIIKALSKDRKFLFEHESKEILKNYGLTTTKEEFVLDEAQSLVAVKKIGYPIVLKVCSPDIIHKTEAGGVVTGLSTSEEVKEAYRRIIKEVKTFNPEAAVYGMIVQEMVSRGYEVIIGAIRDSQFGIVLMFGLGGVFVEAFKDVSFRLFPISMNEVLQMMREIKGFALLKGIRGKKPADLDSIAYAIMKIGEIMRDLPEVKELEINPLIVHNKGFIIVDARIILY